jgi:bifunctional DNA-binding transcriptional regulator/antitoxin component of YhaV-PrlF toxin-antitoxin module
MFSASIIYFRFAIIPSGSRKKIKIKTKKKVVIIVDTVNIKPDKKKYSNNTTPMI